MDGVLIGTQAIGTCFCACLDIDQIIFLFLL